MKPLHTYEFLGNRISINPNQTIDVHIADSGGGSEFHGIDSPEATKIYTALKTAIEPDQPHQADHLATLVRDTAIRLEHGQADLALKELRRELAILDRNHIGS